MSKQNKKADLKRLLQTVSRSREIDGRTEGSGGVAVAIGKPVGMSDAEYIGKYGTQEEIAGLRRLIEERRGRLPKWLYKKCTNCAWKCKMPFGDLDIRKAEGPDYCPSCNVSHFVNGGQLKAMTQAEIKKYEQDENAAWGRTEERYLRNCLLTTNEQRAREGRLPLTFDEFRAMKRRHSRPAAEAKA